jgi:hypothetical protein
VTAMKIENIQNAELKILVKNALRAASRAIVEDLKDILYYSETDNELLSEWHSALQDLKGKVEDCSPLARWVAGEEYQDLKKETEHYLSATIQMQKALK